MSKSESSTEAEGFGRQVAEGQFSGVARGWLMPIANITASDSLRAKLAKLHERHDLCQLIQGSKPSGKEDIC